MPPRHPQRYPQNHSRKRYFNDDEPSSSNYHRRGNNDGYSQGSRGPRFHYLFGHDNKVMRTKTDPDTVPSFGYTNSPQQDHHNHSRDNRGGYYDSKDNHVYDYSTDRRVAREQRRADYENSKYLQQRKKRRYIPGGAIPKYKKAQEYTSNLYCEICERDFRDEAAKSGHDRSKDHRKNLEAKRLEEDQREQEHIQEEPKQGAITFDFAEEEVKKLAEKLKTEKEKLPNPFIQWTEKSLKEAIRSGDPAIKLSIFREIFTELEYHKENCTLFRENWNRKPAATGQHYRQTVMSRPINPVINESQLVLPTTNQTEEPQPQKTESTHQARWVRGPNEGPSTKKPDVIEVASKDEKEEKKKHNYRRTVPKPRAKPKRFSKEASDIMDYYSQSGGNRQLMQQLYVKRFAMPTIPNDNTNEKEPIETVIRKYDVLAQKYKAQDFEYEPFQQGLDEIVTELTKRGTRPNTVQHCLQMKVSTAIELCNFRDCFEPCSKIVDLCDNMEEMDSDILEFIGHWVISLLFKLNESSTRKGNMKNSSQFLKIAMELRKMPVNAICDIRVYEALQVFRAVFSNNFVKFFRSYSSLVVHSSTDMRSQRIMDGLIDYMRERAIMTMCMKGSHCEDPVYSLPATVQLKKVIHILAWDNDNIEEDDDTQAEDVVSFIGSLRPSPVLERMDDFHDVKIQCEGKQAAVHDSEDVIVKELLQWCGNPCKLLDVPMDR